MSRQKITTVEKLIAKRAAIEAEIEAARVREKRKIEVLAMPEFEAILHLPSTVLRTAFARIGTENRTG